MCDVYLSHLHNRLKVWSKSIDQQRKSVIFHVNERDEKCQVDRITQVFFIDSFLTWKSVFPPIFVFLISFSYLFTFFLSLQFHRDRLNSNLNAGKLLVSDLFAAISVELHEKKETRTEISCPLKLRISQTNV